MYPSHDKRIVVIGDVMLDRYWIGGTERISPEAPVPVVKVNQQQARAGGAANVAVNIAALKTSVTLLGMIGQDEAGQQLQQLLQAADVDATLLLQPAATITKLRIVSRQQQLIRLDSEDGFIHADHEALYHAYEQALATADLVIISDYQKGTLTDLVPTLIRAARQRRLPVLIDPKGDFQRYEGAAVLTPNRTEFNTCVQQVLGQTPAVDEADFIQQADQLRQALALEALLVTRSEQGMSLFTDSEPVHLPAQRREVFDVTGAGDTVLSTLAVAWVAGHDLPAAVAYANQAAGVAVTRLGAVAITREDLAATTEPMSGVIIDKTALKNRLGQHRDRRIVMTNGCFDVLHAGHVHYLQQARALGDVLIIAVNDDASVKRLKGETRPVNTLAHRAQVLAALRCVDYVVSFQEDTPRDLIALLQPDVLVKGGDYQVHEIAGHEEVIAAGGEVKILDLVPDLSTTRILQHLN